MYKVAAPVQWMQWTQTIKLLLLTNLSRNLTTSLLLLGNITWIIVGVVLGIVVVAIIVAVVVVLCVRNKKKKSRKDNKGEY